MQMLLTQVTLIISSLAILSLFLFIGKHMIRKAMHVALAVQMMGIFGWTITILANLWLHSNIVEMFIFAFACVAMVAQLWFVALFPNNKIHKGQRTFILVMTLFGIIFAGVSFIPGALFSALEVTQYGYTIISPGFLSLPYTLFAMTAISGAIVLLNKEYRTQEDEVYKNQACYLLLGFIVFFVVSLMTNLLLPVIFQIYFFNAIGPMFSVVLVSYILYVVTVHQFLDIRFVVQRGLIYTAIFAFVVLLYSLILAISSALFSVNSITSDTLSCVLVTIFALITVPKIDARLRKLTDPIFFKDRYDYEEALLELSHVMQETLEMDELIGRAESTLGAILKASMVRIEGRTTHPRTDDLHIPIKLKEDLVGHIIVADKKSGEKYSTQDMRLLRTFARQAAIAIGRVLLYQEVQERAEVLEKKVQERTFALQTMQEKQKGMMLQLSHNLQTPLAILQTKIEGLRQEKNMVDTADSLSGSLHELSAFMSDLLHYARLDNQQDNDIFHTENLSELLQELEEEIKIIAESQSVQIETVIRPNLYVTADKRQLREAFTNVISNALKYIGDSRPKKITITTIKFENKVICEVKDTGIGIASENIQHIFDQFYRPSDSAIKGTGLGLAITKKIIENHGGTITAESILGSGSTFTITLPLD